jgi:hypothetical protein
VSKQASFVPITLDRERHLRLNMNAMAEFEERVGESVVTIFAEGESKIGIKVIRALLWVGLKHEDRSLTIEKAGDLFDYLPGDDFPTKAQAFMVAAIEALSWMLGGVEETKKKLMAAMPSSSGNGGTGASSKG